MRKFTKNRSSIITIVLSLLIVSAFQIPSFADITPVSERTTQVSDAIVTAAGVNSAADVTDTHLAAIRSLNLRNNGMTELKTGDFSGMTGLTSLNLYGNSLSTLPDGIFKGLTALTTLRLGGNTVDPILIAVSLEKVGTDQIKAVVPIGAPFDIIVPISAMNGSISGNATSLTVSKGSVESSTVSLSRTAGTTGAVTSNIGTLPNLPLNHYGYVLSKSDTLPLEIIGADTTPPVTPEPPVETETPTQPDGETETPTQPETPDNTAPSFTDGTTTVRSIVENSETGVDIGSVVSATDAEENTLEYTLSGVDAASFDIVSTTGQLQTKASLDYETKKVYRVTVTVSDGNLTDSISVIISVIDVDETPFVSAFVAVSERTSQVQDAILEALPSELVAADVTQEHLSTITSLSLRKLGITELKTGDFSGLNKLTSLNLFGNMLESLPVGIFDGLTGLTSLRLGGNTVDPMPLLVALQQVSEYQFQAVVHTGAPFNIVLPIEVTNGMISDGSTNIVIPKGSVKSDPFTVTITTGGLSVAIGLLPSLPTNHFGYVLAKSAVCNRTSQVADAIAAAVPGASDCNNVTDVDLALITSLDLSDKSITSLSGDDFAGLVSLTSLDLSNNQLESLPEGFFANLSSLTSVDLNGNSVDPIQLTLSLVKVGEDQFKVVAPLGAPFDIVLPLTVVNGNISDNATSLTILTGTLESPLLAVSRTPNTSAAVTVDVGNLPNLPTTHSGYSLAKSNQVPLEILPALNVAPVFTEGESTTRSVAERTEANSNIGDAVSATDDDRDTLTYTLSGTDAASFAIDSSNGQLKTVVDLDYETKTSYSITITVSDSILTDVIDVTINVTDIDDNRRPVFTEGDNATRVVAENTGSGVDIGNVVSATDDDSDTLVYTLGGTNATSFSINSSTGQLQTKASLNYETKNSYQVEITVSDGNGGTDTIDVTINITDVTETQITPVNERTQQVQDAVVASIDQVNSADNITALHLASITSLDIERKSIKSLKNGDFDGLTALTSLRMDNNELTSLPSGIFDGLSALKSLYLDDNDISSLPSGIFDELSALTTLSLHNNDISSLPSGIFDELTSLTKLYLYRNELTSLPSGIFDELTSLTILDMFENELRSLASDIFDKLTALTSLYLSSNQISLSSGMFDELTSLTTLFLDDNDVSSLPSDIFDDLTALTYLSLANNDLSDVSELEGLTSLERLRLYGNPISDYTPLRNLKTANSEINIDINLSNNIPTFTDGDSTTRSVPENTATGQNIGNAISATDADTGNTLTYSIGGTDADSFAIVSASGQLQTKAALDYETKTSYTVTITVYDGNSGGDKITVTIDVIDEEGAAPSDPKPQFVPKTTVLMHNFPNPFNPETWIPYQLAESSEVTITIYNSNGHVVRTLILGTQSAGIYKSRNKAAHWDGRNQFAEKVATGVYFYTFNARDYTATRKMFIMK